MHNLHQMALHLKTVSTLAAFLVRNGDQFSIRWVTPEYELELCGHGTLSAAYVIFNFLEPTWLTVDLQSNIEELQVSQKGEFITFNFPAKSIERCSIPLLEEGLGLPPIEIYQHKNERCIAVYSTEDEIKQLDPNMPILTKLEHRGITVTAPGNNVDFVSRTFYPKKRFQKTRQQVHRIAC